MFSRIMHIKSQFSMKSYLFWKGTHGLHIAIYVVTSFKKIGKKKWNDKIIKIIK